MSAYPHIEPSRVGPKHQVGREIWTVWLAPGRTLGRMNLTATFSDVPAPFANEFATEADAQRALDTYLENQA